MHPRLSLFGIDIDPLDMPTTVQSILEWVDDREAGCRFVVTPNVDHVVMLSLNSAFRQTYQDASLVLADGKPVVMASRLLKKPLPCVVPGSDLVPGLFSAATADRPLRVFLLGAAEGVAATAAKNMKQRWPHVETVGVYSPSLGFEQDDRENEKILGQIRDTQPDILVVGLGAPKQELWVHRHRQQIAAPAALCVGATIDFLAGEKSRAPVWMRRIGMEWAHRMLSEPKRLIPRYARDAWIFPQLVFRQWVAKS